MAFLTDDSRVKMLQGGLTLRGVAGVAVESGQPVSKKADGFFDPSDATAAADPCRGIALQTVPAGGEFDILILGRVEIATGETAGSLIYTSTTAGGLATAAGANGTVVGQMESASVLFVNPALS